MSFSRLRQVILATMVALAFAVTVSPASAHTYHHHHGYNHHGYNHR